MVIPYRPDTCSCACPGASHLLILTLIPSPAEKSIEMVLPRSFAVPAMLLQQSASPVFVCFGTSGSDICKHNAFCRPMVPLRHDSQSTSGLAQNSLVLNHLSTAYMSSVSFCLDEHTIELK